MLKEALVVILSTLNRYKTKEVLNVNTPSTRPDWAILHGHLNIAVILSDIISQINCFHFVMYIHNCSAHMPSGTHYRTCGMVLGMCEMNVVLYEEHELSILEIVGETLYISSLRVYSNSETSIITCIGITLL